jgi:chromosome segregation ATPase
MGPLNEVQSGNREPETETDWPAATEAETESWQPETETEDAQHETGNWEPESDDTEPQPPPRMLDQPPMNSRSRQVKELVNSYMDQISQEKAELEKLKSKKDKVYREKYLALESKVEADIASITERMLEKEGRILELKERVLDLPDKVGEVEAVHEALEKLESDGKDVLEKTKSDVEEFIQSTARSREEIQMQIKEGKGRLDEEKNKVDALRELCQEVDSSAASIDETLENTGEEIKALDDKMRVLLTELEDATEMKVEISEMVDKLSGSVADKEERLSRLSSHLESIDKVEQWGREYVSDYERKIDDISEYVQTSEDELATLRRSAESAYVQKYLRELDGITTTYESSIDDIIAQEKDIDSKIADSKKRLSSLVKDSKEMMQKMRAGATDFTARRRAVSEKSERILALVEEKGLERGKLFEDVEEEPRAPRPKTRNRKPKTKNKRGRPKKSKKSGKKR